MKKILHLTITEKPSASALDVIEKQKLSTSAQIEVMPLTTKNTREVLEKIFAADSICVWPKG